MIIGVRILWFLNRCTVSEKQCSSILKMTTKILYYTIAIYFKGILASIIFYKAIKKWVGSRANIGLKIEMRDEVTFFNADFQNEAVFFASKNRNEVIFLKPNFRMRRGFSRRTEIEMRHLFFSHCVHTNDEIRHQAFTLWYLCTIALLYLDI